MSSRAGQKLQGRDRRRARVRKKAFGTSERPRLSVFRSAKHIYAQVIDDVAGVTLVSASTQDKAIRGDLEGKKCDQATLVGQAVAERCRAKSIEAVVFDRNGYRYHGRVRAVADGARKGGLAF